MSVARFRVSGRLDMAARLGYGTVEIDRNAGLFSVRPLRRRRIYTLPLGTVADMVCRSIIQAEAAEKRRTRKASRRR